MQNKTFLSNFIYEMNAINSKHRSYMYVLLIKITKKCFEMNAKIAIGKLVENKNERKKDHKRKKKHITHIEAVHANK